MYSYEVYVDKICKRDQIHAWNKVNGDYIEGHGYWDDNGGVYLGVSKKNDRYIRKRMDIVLSPDEWDIYVMVPFKKVENNVAQRTKN